MAAKKKVTLSLDSKIYSDFQEYCEKNAVMLSKKIEIVMKEIMKDKKGKKSLFLFGFLFMVFLLAGGLNAAQIFFYGFESGNLSSWNLSAAPGAKNWTNSTINPYQGSYHAQSNPSSSNEPASIMYKTISTAGYENININYYRWLVLPTNLKKFNVSWWNGSVWNNLEYAYNVDEIIYSYRLYSLSSYANNNPNFKIRFECTSSAINDFCRLDNLNITGDIIYNLPPLINITYPQNTSYNINVSAINYTFIETNPGSCWYSNNSGVWNSSAQACGANWTELISNQGSNTWRVYANDTNGNLNWSDVTFFKDTIKPDIRIIYPANNTNTTDISLNVNYTRSDANLESCWWTENNGITNNSLTNCENIIGQTWNEGIHNITVYVNDSANNINSSSIRFRIDTTGPLINIVYPEQKTYGYNTSLPLNYTLSDALGISSCWYNLDNGVNRTIPNCQNIIFNTSDESSHILYFYANDSLGNLGYSSKSFSVSTTLAVDLLKPNDNAWLNYNNIEFNYTVNTASSIKNCSLWGNFDGVWKLNQTNSSFVNSSGGINKFSANLPDGNYVWNVFCSGTYNAFAQDNYTLNIDSINPVLDIQYPINNTIFRQNVSIPINFTVSDTNLEKCWYSFDNGLTNRSIICIDGRNNLSIGYSAGNYNISFYVNDSAGNVALRKIYNISIEQDSIAPNMTLTEPIGTKTSKTGIPLQFSVSDNVDSLNELSCWYHVYRGASPEISNTSISCLINSFSLDVSGDALYTLSFYVRDRTGNINFTNSNFSVSTATAPPSGEGGGGGGGGGSSFSSNKTKTLSNKLEISKLENIIINEGDKKIISLNVKNIGASFFNNCRLIFIGEANSWFYSNQITGISPGENINFVFNLNVPESVEKKDYFNELEVKCDEALNSENFIISFPKTLHGIEIKEIKQEKNKLKLNYVFNNDNNLDKTSVDIWIIDNDGIETNRIKDEFEIKQSLTERSVSIDLSNNPAGIYSVYFALSSDLNNYLKQSIILGKSSTTGFAILDNPTGKLIGYIVFVMIILVVIFFIIRSKWNEKNNTSKS